MPRTTEDLFRRYGPAYRWLVMLMAMLCSISAVLSVTIVNVAIPGIMGAFGMDQVQAQWLSAGYLAAMTSTMLLLDYTIKAFGQRSSMLVALAAFLIAAFMGGLAEDSESMIVARFIQGAAGGIMQPMGMLAVYQVFPPERRGTAMGIYGLGVVMAPAVGPYCGGLLVDALSWRYVFFVGVPLAVISMLLTVLFMPSSGKAAKRPRFDWLGFAALVLFLACLLSAFSDGPRDGWNSEFVVFRLVAAVLLLFGFIAWENYTDVPLLDLSLYRRPAFAGAAFVSAILGAGLFGSTYLIPLFVQTVQDLTPTLSGALLLPAGISMVILVPLTGRLADRYDPGIIVTGGLVMFVISFWLFSFADVRTDLPTMAAWIMISRIGMAFIFPALNAGSVRMLPTHLLAQGAASMNFMRQLGGAFGVNLLAVLLQQQTAKFSAPLFASQTPDNALVGEYLQHAQRLAAPSGLADAAIEEVARAHLTQSLLEQASSLAFSVSFQVSAAALALSLVGGVLMIGERKRALGAHN